jgi:hypothetical protein
MSVGVCVCVCVSMYVCLCVVYIHTRYKLFFGSARTNKRHHHHTQNTNKYCRRRIFDRFVGQDVGGCVSCHRHCSYRVQGPL